MRLLECHIAGFGSFRNYRLTFDGGLNLILQPNGWGKSTLVAYVKAMLYGFDRKRVRNVRDNERLRYMPWDGGTYGGTLDFEVRGTAYRVLRTFGRTAAGDSCKVLDLATGEAVDNVGPNVGEWVFALDVNAFQRSVFVGQNGFGFDGSTAGLRDRLNALVNETEDTVGLDRVLAQLDERRKHYQRTGNRGLIAEVSARMSRLVERQRECDATIDQVGNLQGRLRELDGSISEVSGQLAAARDRLELAQGDEQRLRALASVHDQLVARSRAASEAVVTLARQAGPAPTEAELDALRQDIEGLRRWDGERAAAQQRIAAAESRRAHLAERYAGQLPTKEVVDELRRQRAEHAHRIEMIERSRPAESDRFAAIDAALRIDPTLLDQARSALGEWPFVTAGLRAADEKQREIDAADAIWAERRKAALALWQQTARLRRELPEDGERRVDQLSRLAEDLQTQVQERASLLARIEVARREVADDVGQGTPPNLPNVRELQRMDEAARTLREASARRLETQARLAEVRREVEEQARMRADAEEALRRARTTVADAEVARAQAVAREASAKAALTEAQATGRGSGAAPAIACLVAAVLAAAAGIAFVPVLFALAAVLAVVGIVLLLRRPARNDSDARSRQEELDAAQIALGQSDAALVECRAQVDVAARTLAETVAICEQQAGLLDEAQRKADAADEQDARAAEDLVALVAPYYPDETVGRDAALTRVPLLRAEVARRAGAREQGGDARARLATLEAELEGAAARAREQLAAVGLPTTGDLAADALAARRRADELARAYAELDDSERRLAHSIDEALSEDVARPDLHDGAAIVRLLSQDGSPNVVHERVVVSNTHAAAERLVAGLEPAFRVFGIDDADLSIAMERLSQGVSGYLDYRARLDGDARERHRAEQAANDLAATLDAQARAFGLAGREDLDDAALATLDGDAAEAERIAWEARAARDAAREADVAKARAEDVVRRLLAQYDLGDAADLATALDQLTAHARKAEELARAAELARGELATWEREHGEQLAALSRAQDGAAGNQQARDAVAVLERRREELVGERAQCEERRAVLLGELEEYPTIVQEIRLLAIAKQEATANLFTVQRTSEYLQAARDSLDNRYLGGLTERFNDYATTWLADEGLSVKVAGDFAVSVGDGAAEHPVEAYSTGYRDVLDVCLRMALIDTVFEEEQPFVVMDDPFAGLDEEKVARAIALLSLLAEQRQIIYLTCHPSRLKAGATTPSAAFSLPPQRAERELPRARARREAQERARAQAALVASYHVEPPTHGRALIAPEAGRRSISSNMFTVRFVADPSSGKRDNVFEVHFIDAKGRALCERQIVEVIDGKVVPDRLRFSLSTSDDSGDAYDLIVHERGREPEVLAARVAYRADVAFANDDFGF